MAAISSITNITARVTTIRTATAQATTGQTDYIYVPRAARYCKVHLNLTASAGNTPQLDLTLFEVDPISVDDTYNMHLGGITLVDQNATAARYVIDIGPGVTGIADDVTLAATGNVRAAINTILPTIMGLTVTLDRTSADETYTYTLAVQFDSIGS